ncbi:MAG: heavy-metal-associated domain-containing protein [Betaproteobacteria bacterium]
MEQVFRVEGMHCGGCVNRVTQALKTIADEATVTLDPPRAVLSVQAPLTLEAVRAAVAKAGEYVVEPA